MLFWCYRDVDTCTNRVRHLRRLNPRLPIYGLFGGPVTDSAVFAGRLAPWLDDFWAFPEDADRDWKWRHGDLVLARWFTERGHELAWDSVFVAQWDLVATRPLSLCLPAMHAGEMLLSGLRPVGEVERWWQWTTLADRRREYEAFLDLVARRYGAVADPLCCQFIAMVLPRTFFERYVEIAQPELGFLEYKVPVYAQAFGVPLVPDTCFRPFWPEEPGAESARRGARMFHAWPSPLRLPTMFLEAWRPGGRRVFHPYPGIYPHDVRSVGEALRRRARRREVAATS